MKECPKCFGTGYIEHNKCHGMGCNQCEDGEIICPQCDGTGVVNGKNNNQEEEENNDQEREEENE